MKKLIKTFNLIRNFNYYYKLALVAKKQNDSILFYMYLLYARQNLFLYRFYIDNVLKI